MKSVLTLFFFLFISSFSFFSFSLEVREGVLRTPDERFENLEDYPFKPNYMVIEDLRLFFYPPNPLFRDVVKSSL